MYLNADMDIGKDFKVLNLDTGEIIDHITEAWDEGYKSYVQLQINSDKSLVKCDKCNQVIYKRIKANIQFVYDPIN